MTHYTGGAIPEGGTWWHVAPAPDLITTTPRQRWKHAHHAARWERRYGKPKALFTGQLGTFDGFRIIRSTP